MSFLGERLTGRKEEEPGDPLRWGFTQADRPGSWRVGGYELTLRLRGPLAIGLSVPLLTLRTHSLEGSPRVRSNHAFSKIHSFPGISPSRAQRRGEGTHGLPDDPPEAVVHGFGDLPISSRLPDRQSG
jgi:hypothetical protein